MTGVPRALARAFPDEVEYHRDDPTVIATPTERILVPTPIRAVVRILKEIDPEPTFNVVDLGCGDGRFVIAAAYLYGCTGVGVDIRPDVLKVARNKAEELGVGDRVEFIEEDVRNVNPEDLNPDVVYMYLMPSLLAEIRDDLLKADALVISNLFPVPGLRADREIRLDEFRKAYVYDLRG